MQKPVNKPVAIVLGGSNPHISLIEKLKNRGYYTILIDYYNNPLARIFAHEHIQETTLDNEKVLQIAKQKNASIVICACLDQPIPVACWVSEKMNLPSPFSYETSKYVTDKALMKQRMFENDIPSSKFIIVNKDEQYEIDDLKFPLIIKPVDSTGSQGVQRVFNIDDVTFAVNNALAKSLSGRVIIEEFCEGDEVSFYYFIKDGFASLIMTRQKFNRFFDNGKSIVYYQSFIPSKFEDRTLSLMKKAATDIASSFELNNVPILIQAKINNGTISIIEFMARVGGGLGNKSVMLSSGIDLLDAYINSWLKNKLDIKPKKPQFLLSENTIYASEGIFSNVLNHVELFNNKIIDDYNVLKTVGSKIPAGLSSSNKVFSFIVKGYTLEELQNKIKVAYKELDVIDINNKSIMRKDIWPSIN